MSFMLEYWSSLVDFEYIIYSGYKHNQLFGISVSFFSSSCLSALGSLVTIINNLVWTATYTHTSMHPCMDVAIHLPIHLSMHVPMYPPSYYLTPTHSSVCLSGMCQVLARSQLGILSLYNSAITFHANSTCRWCSDSQARQPAQAQPITKQH